MHIFLEYGFYKEQVCLVWCLKGKSGWSRALQKSSCVNKSTPETVGDVKLGLLGVQRRTYRWEPSDCPG